mgnify:CR=1 FL=1
MAAAGRGAAIWGSVGYDISSVPRYISIVVRQSSPRICYESLVGLDLYIDAYGHENISGNRK